MAKVFTMRQVSKQNLVHTWKRLFLAPMDLKKAYTIQLTGMLCDEL